MSSKREPSQESRRGSRCLVQTVADAFGEDAKLEAVTLDRGARRISVATWGKRETKELEARLAGTLQEAEAATDQETCCLLAGQDDCGACAIGPDEAGRAGLTVSCADNRMTIARATCPTAPRFWRWKEIPWPRVVPREVEIPEDEHALNEWKWQLLAALLCGTFGLAAWALGDAAYAIGFHAAAYVAGAWFAAEEVRERLQARTLDVHFLMLAVAAGSAAIGQWEEGTVLLFLFSLSGALEHYAMGRTQREIRSLFRAAPKEALVLEPDGAERPVPVPQLRSGQRLLLKPGAQFPVDAEVVKGRTAADESTLTGEATPVDKGIGDVLLAGTMNLWGGVEAVVLRPASESSLQRIIRLIREAQHGKAPSQRFTDRFGTRYTYGILGLTLLMFFVWWLGFGLPAFTSDGPVSSAFKRAMTLLVVASPCALVLSIPSAVLAAIAWGARRGILFRGGAAVEDLAETGVVALDKTGTLTTGDLRVERIESFPPGREDEVARLAFSVERLSEHPLARAIRRHGKQVGWSALDIDRFESVTGLGLRAEWQGQPVLLGRREWVDGADAVPGDRAAKAAQRAETTPVDSEHSEVWLAWGDLKGRVVLQDEIRAAAAGVIDELRGLGLRTVVLTGDRPGAAEKLRTTLHLDDVRAGLKPEEKVGAIQQLRSSGGRVAMVGDGVNDAPSLAAADVGVAMGARGSDAALEQADIVLMNDRLENFLAAYRLSQRARRVIRQNLLVSLGAVVVLVGFAITGGIELTTGVLGHEGSTVVVVMNSLRLILSRWSNE